MGNDSTDSRTGGIRVGRMVLGMVGTNCYYIFRETGTPVKPVILIDPADAGERIYDSLVQNDFRIEGILLTHAHFDHIGGIPGIQARFAANGEETSVQVACLAEERPLCEDPELNCSASLDGNSLTIWPDVLLKDGDTIDAAQIRLEVIATPGHTAGGCCYYVQEAGILFSGDTLFEGSVGRTDLPTGSMGTLVRSIREKLFVLPDDTLVLPGHGEGTTIGNEKRYNSFL